jgi:hypothetical protein
MCVEGTFYAMFGGLFNPAFYVLLHPLLTTHLQNEIADPTAPIDPLIRALLHLGVTPAELGELLAEA